MDWSDPAVHFGSGRLDRALRDFCDTTLQEIRKRVLELLERLRASRVTLDYLRQVSSAEMVSGKKSSSSKTKGTSPVSVMMPLNEEATNRVKGYLRRKVEKLKHSDGQEFRNLVPQDRENFEKGFDTFVEKCMEKSKEHLNSWMEEHVSSGAAQPQLWKIYVGFQRQLRDTCAVQSRKPLPPPLFMKKEEDVDHQSPVCHAYPVLSRPITAAAYPYEHHHHHPYALAPPPRQPPPPPLMPSHGRTQSCAEFGRFVPVHPHGYHPVNAPYLLVPYHIRHESVAGYPATTPPHELVEYGDPWMPGVAVQDDSDVSRCCYDPTMVSAGYPYVTNRAYASESPPGGAGTRYYMHGRLG